MFDNRRAEDSQNDVQTGPDSSEIQPWDVLCSISNTYQLHHFRFSGCLSQVAACQNLKTKETLAIKILRKRATDSQEPNRELAMLKRIRGLDPDNIVRLFEDFEHKGHICLAFEMLDKNLHELLRERHGNPLCLQEIKPIAKQLLHALESLEAVGVIHTSIKPHNIMLVSLKDQPFRVKLIDFGSAVLAAGAGRSVISQPVGYRSPDVILGLPISEAIDMWSLGGVLATMYLGSLPFPQRCHYDLMKTMVETLGQPEDRLLSDGTNTLLYFSLNQDSTEPAWRLKTADEYKAATGFTPQNQGGSPMRFTHLRDLSMLHPEENFVSKAVFVSLLSMMLCLNPHSRITPSQALIHPFLTLSKLDDCLLTSSHEMASGSLTDEPPVEGGDMAAADTVRGASAIVSSTDVTSAATESRNTDSEVNCSGVENLPAVSSDVEASEGAPVSADVVTVPSNDASGSPLVTGLNDNFSANEEPTGADKDKVTLSFTDDSITATCMTEPDGAAVTSPSTGGALFSPLKVDFTNDSICSDEASAGSERFSIRMFMALCGCCGSVDTIE